MFRILSTSTNDTMGEEIGDYYPVFHDAFAPNTQSTERLKKAGLAKTFKGPQAKFDFGVPSPLLIQLNTVYWSFSQPL